MQSGKGEGEMIELNGETYLDGNEACNLLGIKLSTLYTYVSRGVLKSYKQGIKRQRLYKRAELEELLQLRPSIQPPAPVKRHGDEDNDDDTDLPRAEDWVPNV
jgi:excisionase family DNA binding protein